MAKGDLTAQRLRELLNYNAETGVFTWRINRQGGKAAVGATAGGLNSRGYVVITIDVWPYAAHRLAWLYTHDVWPTMILDHINQIKTDNRMVNLREATYSVNNQNINQASSRSLSGLRGVSRAPYGKDKWEARITVNGRKVFIGTFRGADQAHAAYVAAKRKLQHHGSAC